MHLYKVFFLTSLKSLSDKIYQGPLIKREKRKERKKSQVPAIFLTMAAEGVVPFTEAEQTDHDRQKVIFLCVKFEVSMKHPCRSIKKGTGLIGTKVLAGV